MSTGHGSLGNEIKQQKPFHSLRMEAVLGLLRTADQLHRRFESVLAPVGITRQQYNVLRILRGAGDDGLPVLEIRDRMIERTPGITRLLDRLEKKALVNRKRCTADRRVVYARITDEGLGMLSDLDAPVEAADDAVLDMLSENEVKQMITLLDRVRSSGSITTSPHFITSEV